MDQHIFPNPWSATFLPSRRIGLTLQLGTLAITLAGATFSFIKTNQAISNLGFYGWLMLSLLLFVPTPFLAYQSFAISRAIYRLERDGLRLRWGWRTEDIPLPEIQWIRPAHDLTAPLPLPWPRWPGSLSGTRQVEGLGPVEFMASDLRNLLLVATPQRIFAISPADPRSFIHTYRSINELGSLAPLRAKSVFPTFIFSDLWQDRGARWLLLASLVLGVGLLLWVVLIIPTHPSLSLGYMPSGGPEQAGPGAHLVLLPVLNGLSLLIDLGVGVYFYRRPDGKLMAYLLWSVSILTSIIFTISVLFIIHTG